MRASEGFDKTGEVIGHIVAAELHKHTGQPLEADTIESIRQILTYTIGIVGLQECAEILDVTKQRIYQMNQGETTLPLPAPIARVHATRLWLKQDIQAFNEHRRSK